MSTKIEVTNLLDIVKKRKGLLTIAGIFSVISSVLQIIPFIAVYNIVAELLMHAQDPGSMDKDLIIKWGIITLISLFGTLIAFYISGMSSHIAAFQILYEMRMNLTQHLSRVHLGYHLKRNTGELKKIIEVSVEKIETFIAHQLPDIISAIVIPLLLVGYLIWADYRLAIILIIPIGIGYYIQSRMYKSEEGKKAYRDYQFAIEEMSATGVEYVKGMPAIKMFGMKASTFLTFKKAIYAYRDIALHITDLFKRSYSTFIVIIGSIFVFIVPFGIIFLTTDSNTQAFAITFILYLLVTPSLTPPLMRLMYLGSEMREIVEGNKRIQEILEEPIVIEPERPLEPSDYSIKFDNVCFAYEEKNSDDYKEILHEIDLVANEKQMTALVGPSGSGKSTIANLILRFWDVQKGTISIGGVPIQEIGTSQLMDLVSFVFQDVHLFYDTIEENIRMGNKTATKEEVIQAAKTANCHDFIEELEKGYDTRIGEGGTYLSGGEAQRIAIARALLKNAPILILDEATAYADAENESKIQQAIANLVKGKTVIIIAHRLSSIRHADQIIVLHQGTVIERGKHEDLLATKGLYHDMWQAHIHAGSWKLSKDKRSEVKVNE